MRYAQTRSQARQLTRRRADRRKGLTSEFTALGSDEERAHRRADLAASGLVLPDWYRARYPDVAETNDPAAHFAAYGLYEDRQPNPYFDPAWYRQTYPESADSALPPLLHYARHGWRLGHDPSPHFDQSAYARLTDWTPNEGEPLAHFLKHGLPGVTDQPPVVPDRSDHVVLVRHEEIAASGLVDADWYQARYADVAEVKDPVAHFSSYGLYEGRRPNPYVDPDWYRQTYPDAAASGLPAVLHYLRRGWRIGHDPSPRFTQDVYATLTGWTQDDGEPLVRFLKNGLPELTAEPAVDPDDPDHAIDVNEEGVRREELRASGLFHEAWYRARYPDLTRTDDVLKHFIAQGHAENRWPNPYFDPDWYRRTYPDAATSDLPAVLHYLRHGWRLGRHPSRHFAQDVYAALTGWTPDDGEPLALFLKDGLPKLTGAPAVDPGDPDHAIDVTEDSIWREEIRASGLFHEAWYRARYPDLANLPLLLDHFVAQGHAENRWPSPYFDPSWYDLTYPDRADSDLPSVLRYLRHGWQRGHDTAPHFRQNVYAALTGWTPDDGEPLARLLRDGLPELTDEPAVDPNDPDHAIDIDEEGVWREEVRASGLFHEAWYRARYPDIADLPLVLDHFVRQGRTEKRWPNPYLDPGWYRRTYRDAAESDLPPVLHYLRHGWRQGHDPSPRFSQGAYAALTGWTPDQGEPLARFLKDGLPELTGETPVDPVDPDHAIDVTEESIWRKELRASGLFDEAWYRARYSDLAERDDVLAHFVAQGHAEDRRPNPYVDPVWYRQTYEDAASSDLPAVLHYLRHGWRQGHDPSPRFRQDAYAALTGWTPDAGEPLARFLEDSLPELTDESAVDPDRPEHVVHIGHAAAAPVLAGNRLRHALDYRPAASPSEPGTFTPNRLTIHWVVPDFLPGGGGHMTIFRMVRELALRGHRQIIWLHGEGPHPHAEGAYDDILRHFLTLDAEVRHVEDADLAAAPGDVAIATDWGSAWIVRAMGGVKRGFYFVQDDEAIHFPRGAEQLLADATYDMDLDGICASPWLADKMRARGRWARDFYLAADQDVYRPHLDRETRPEWPRIAFYARTSTARRAVELGLLGLEELARRGHRFLVDFFGAGSVLEEAPYPFVVHGSLPPEGLAELYRRATLGVVFSATNYSLVPGEMMASGLPVVELDVESTRAIYPEDVAALAPIEPAAIADTMEALLADPARRRAQAEAALAWVSRFSWIEAADIVERALTERLAELGHTALAPAAPRTSPKASVVIPALDGGPLLMEVLERVKTQRFLAPFEILVIDSGSGDGTAERIEADPAVRLHRIEPGAFGHGRTRNLGVELTAGDYVAFLTQDALPLGDNWLADLVMALDHDTRAGAAFGRHVAHDGADPFAKRDIAAHFRQFHALPLAHSRDLARDGRASSDTHWRQLMHFYSNNNAMLRRSVWQEIPMRDVAYGEDQLFARDILEAGYAKLYVPTSVVAHSHHYGADETFERARTEAAFFRTHFGYDLMPEGALEDRLASTNARDAAWGRAHGVAAEAIAARQALNAARMRGHQAGRRLAEAQVEGTAA